MITAASNSNHGNQDSAEKWLQSMEDANFKPDARQYTDLINRASKVGDLEAAETWTCFSYFQDVCFNRVNQLWTLWLMTNDNVSSFYFSVCWPSPPNSRKVLYRKWQEPKSCQMRSPTLPWWMRRPERKAQHMQIIICKRCWPWIFDRPSSPMGHCFERGSKRRSTLRLWQCLSRCDVQVFAAMCCTTPRLLSACLGWSVSMRSSQCWRTCVVSASTRMSSAARFWKMPSGPRSMLEYIKNSGWTSTVARVLTRLG